MLVPLSELRQIIDLKQSNNEDNRKTFILKSWEKKFFNLPQNIGIKHITLLVRSLIGNNPKLNENEWIQLSNLSRKYNFLQFGNYCLNRIRVEGIKDNKYEYYFTKLCYLNRPNVSWSKIMKNISLNSTDVDIQVITLYIK